MIQRWVREDDPIFLQRDPANRHSRNAVKVLTRSGQHIGFVPEDDAKEVADSESESALASTPPCAAELDMLA